MKPRTLDPERLTKPIREPMDTSALALPKPGPREKRWHFRADGHMKACEYCGTEFHMMAPSSKYCSQSCYDRAQWRRRHPEASKPGIIVRRCQQCDNEYSVRVTDFTHGKCRFCSPSCWYAYLREHPPQIKPRCRKPKKRKLCVCHKCGKEFEPSYWTRRPRKFCSNKCYFSSRNGFTSTKCSGCGTVFSHKKLRTRPRKFCSKACQAKHQQNSNHPMWRGNRRQDRGPDWKQIRHDIRVRDLASCQACGAQEPERTLLHVDHIVPYRLAKRYGNANDPRNLITNCQPCHASKTHVEARLLRGDVIGFMAEMKRFGYSDAVDDALDLYSLHPGPAWSRRSEEE